jgi:hypothetical protein
MLGQPGLDWLKVSPNIDTVRMNARRDEIVGLLPLNLRMKSFLLFWR